MFLNSKIRNRDFLDWLVLTMGVVNLIIGIQILSYLSYLNMFVAGCCISSWLLSGKINSGAILLEKYHLLSKELLKFIEGENNTPESKNKKGGKKK